MKTIWNLNFATKKKKAWQSLGRWMALWNWNPSFSCQFCWLTRQSEKVCLKLNIQKTKIRASSPITSWQVDRETMETVMNFIFLITKIIADGGCRHEIKTLPPWKVRYNKPKQHIKKQRHYFANKVLSSQSCGFSSSHVWIWEMDYKER